MALIQNLADHGMGASSIHANQPSTTRLVLLQDVDRGMVATYGARYIEGRWRRDGCGDDLTEELTDAAIWFESPLFLPSSGPLIVLGDRLDLGSPK